MSKNSTKKADPCGNLILLGAILLLVVAVIALAYTLGAFMDPRFPSEKLENLENNTMTVPEGYTFFGMVESPKFQSQVILFCQNSETDAVVICTGGKIGDEITIPSGYKAIGVFAVQSPSEDLYFMCELPTGEITICKHMSAKK